MQEPTNAKARTHRRGLLAGSAAAVGLIGLARAAKAQAPVKSPTLEAVQKRGQLISGVDTGIPGYAFQDAAGK